LGISFEATKILGPVTESLLAIVPEWRVSQVVRQAGHVDYVWAQTQVAGHFSSDLSNFERVSQPGSRKISTRWLENLSFGSQPAQCR
jgi:hypothetical protein